MLSYNVAGLPEGLSASMPARNSPLISPLLNDYDLVLLQEDFSYRAQIASMVRLPHASPPDLRGESLGDGLSVFSNLALRDFDRIRWSMCFGMFDSGSDCLTPKGFASMRVEVTPDLAIDVYDLHADAGDGPSDAAARASNLAQVAAAVLVRSAGRAVIVAGDFNTRHTRDGSLQTLRDATGLRDVWVDLMRGGQAPPVGTPLPCTSDPNDVACERIDKILYRSSDTVRLVPLAYTVEGARFVDAQGAPLSDHRPVAAHFELRRAD
ncbi:MAG: endonuclease/exonuclease/phosphatase family protein [Polyangiales bacterium]